MTSPGSASFMVGPVVALGAVGVIVLLLRWAFGPSRSLVARRPQPGAPTEYGLLERVASPATMIEAELVRRRLADAGLRVTLAPTTEGPGVLVFPEDAKVARALLDSPPRPPGSRPPPPG